MVDISNNTAQTMAIIIIAKVNNMFTTIKFIFVKELQVRPDIKLTIISGMYDKQQRKDFSLKFIKNQRSTF